MRSFAILWMTALLAAAPLPAQTVQEIPATLSPYLTNGVVPPGDYRWMRGRFAGASPEEAKVFYEVAKFNQACADQSRATMRQKMAAIGQSYDPGEDAFNQPIACRQFAWPLMATGSDWAAFSAALDRVKPYALGLLRGVELAEQEVIGHGDFAQQLRTRTLGEQMLRYASIENQKHEGITRDFTPLEHQVYDGIVYRALQERDQANTEWLAEAIRTKGWPSRATVGADAAGAAWLLAQHADGDPAFQLTALRLMAPLAAKGDVDPVNYAMLTDRVQLRLSGKQRYGTQWTCVAGKRAPRPLERNAPATDALRKNVNLDTLKENAARIDALYGPCPQS